MMYEGKLDIETAQYPQEHQGDMYEVYFTPYQSPELPLPALKFKGEEKLRAFLDKEIDCSAGAAKDAITDLHQRNRAVIHYMQLPDEILWCIKQLG